MKRLGFYAAEYLAEQAKHKKNIWVLDGDLADSNGAEEFVKSHAERYIAAGIAEQNMVTLAAGLATAGIAPWVFSFAAFLVYQAYNQIRTSIAQTKLPVTLIGTHAGGCGGRNGKTHTALNDIAAIRSLNNISIWAPACQRDVKNAIDDILKQKNPAYLRLARDPQFIECESDEPVYWIGEPTPIALITYGYATQWACEAKVILEQANIKIGILHFNKVWPLEPEELRYLLQPVTQGFVVEDHCQVGGLFSALFELNLDIKLHCLAWPKSWSGQSGETMQLREAFQLSPIDIAMTLLAKTNLKRNNENISKEIWS